MPVVLAGLLASLALIIAIGAQNAFVLRQGLARNHIGLVIAICAGSDALLIAIGVSGLAGAIRTYPQVLDVLTWVGVIYLTGFALHSFWKARRPTALVASGELPRSAAAVALMALGFTYLNPHVYLDTVLMLGTIANQYGPDRWLFALGAAAASLLWFTILGLGARFSSRWMSRPATWRILDILIGIVMLAIAVKLLRSGL